MKSLQIDEKFSILYDENNNDRPMQVLRHGEFHYDLNVATSNWVIALFYALLEVEQSGEKANEFNKKADEVKASEWDNVNTGDILA